MSHKSSSVPLCLTLIFAFCLPDLGAEQKRSLAGNRKLSYLVTPPTVDDWQDLFNEGIFYGRVRTNFFFWDWDTEIAGKQKDHEALGVGGSIVYRTATWQGLSFTVGLYGTSNPFTRIARDEVGLLKAGKDVLSRYEVSRGGSYHYIVLGQGTVNVALGDSYVQGGRQLFESVFTASNDTKMIPNSFDGISLVNKSFAGTTLRAAWFQRQKLRDHTDAHDVITFRNADGESWGNQDDSAIHKGLSYDRLRAAGESTDNDLLILTAKSQIGAGTTLEVSGLLVPDLLSNLTLEVNQDWALGDWSFRPGARLMVQMDEGAGAIGGASLNGNVSSADPRGYTDPDSLDTNLIGLRGIFTHPEKIVSLQLGYTRVDDKADLVAPWRGFPTGGYTRAMGQYNWRADTSTYMLEVKMDYGRLNWVKGLKSTLRYAIMDFDEGKGFTDRSVLHLDFIQQITWVEGLEGRLRMAFVDDEGNSDYNEYRIEFNYLF